MHFDKEYFQPFKFTNKILKDYFENAMRDLKIAREDKFEEVKFVYSYNALIKTGIVLIGKIGKVKVRSVPGHHLKILEKMSEILKDEDVFTVGNSMRKKRNLDFYSGGEVISEKEAREYLEFVEKLIAKVKQIFFK